MPATSKRWGGVLTGGAVDLYFDSAFPTLAAQKASGSEVIARRWKQDSPTYWSTFVALKASGIERVDDLVGKVIAFEEPFSTSGFLLPAGTLLERGFTITEVSSPDEDVAGGVIGYYFSFDEQNSIALLLMGKVAGAGISDQDYEELPADVKQKIVAFDRSIAVPRQLVSTRAGLPGKLVDKIRDLLVGMDETDEGRQILEGLKNTRRFDPLPPGSETALSDLADQIRLVDQSRSQ